uniref:Uncharacterized protein n=1 Tax=Homalodisca liturata TaxID=320908 RepID=A0A1B6IHF4_9HEMI
MFGVDLGSSYIRMAHFNNKQAEIVHVSFNPPIGSGLVYFSGTSIHIGDDITADIFNRKNHETFGVMRLIGRHYDTSVQRFSAYLPYTVLNVDGLPMIGCTHQGIKKMISPEHLRPQASCDHCCNQGQNAAQHNCQRYYCYCHLQDGCRVLAS